MSAKQLEPTAVGLPVFPLPEAPLAMAASAPDANAFELGSHRRAREALDFGLRMDCPGYNIFVVGEDRSGRMTATLAFLNETYRTKPPANDWIYLTNFRRPHRPRPYRLPLGVGRRFRDRLQDIVPKFAEALRQAFQDPGFVERVESATRDFNADMAAAFNEVQQVANGHGMQLHRTGEGIAVTAPGPDGQPVTLDKLTQEARDQLEPGWIEVREMLARFVRASQERQLMLNQHLTTLRRQAAEAGVGPIFDDLATEFADHMGLARWLTEMQVDVGDNVDEILAAVPPKGAEREPAQAEAAAALERRYAVNLFVDRADETNAPVVLEPEPTRERLFGAFEYRMVNGVLQTDAGMLRAGALHRANGGVLVLRAESIAREPGVWQLLKDALRDGEIRIEQRVGPPGMPIAGAPQPKPVKLSVKVVLVGAPRWYYTFFSVDSDFQAFFKVKADIDPDVRAIPENLGPYVGLIQQAAKLRGGHPCNDQAICYLLGQCARWAGQRDRLTARFELLEDVIAEAGARVNGDSSAPITAQIVRETLEERRRRNARVEDRSQEIIQDGVIMIDTEGAAVGQVNGLTVRDVGDHSFGSPARVTARVFAGKGGVINIERMTAMGGPIQQKGAMVVEGYLNGTFARDFPLCFSASITFEQNYGGVEGDSASLAELLAILSSLAEVPLRQDIAITGSVNQLGRAQAIGGATDKIEGFFHTCQERGLTGSQGVVLPVSNERHITLRDEVAEAVAAGQFHIWSVADIAEAAELFTGMVVGTPGPDGGFPEDSLYGRVQARLEVFDRILTARAGHLG